MAEDSENEDKTEDPSAYRLEKSREKGEVAISRELNTIVVLIACFMVFIFSTFYMYELISKFIEDIYRLSPDATLTKEGSLKLFESAIITLLKSILPVSLAAIVFSLAIPLVQVGFVFAPELIEAKLERINPLEGFKRVFSMKSVFQLLKGILKFILVFVVTYWMLDEVTKSLIGFFHADLPTLLSFASHLATKVVASIFLGLFVLAVIDFGYEKYSFWQKMKMSKRELKEELKEREGNPEIRSKIKSIQREMARKRMMKEVPKADVIVTNPTHISVALKYDKEKMVAPIVVAKGADNIALRIREIAKDNGVPIVENITVARAIYKEVKLGESIPRNLYPVVAEILRFVYRLKKKANVLSSNTKSTSTERVVG